MAVDIYLVIPPPPAVPDQPAVSAELVQDKYFATTFKGASVIEVRQFSLGEENLTTIGSAASRVSLAEGMWYEALPTGLRGRLRMIVSNPPYVTEAEFPGLPREVRDHEPVGALVAGPTGRECLEHLVAAGLDWLAPAGALVLELAPHQAGPMRAVAERAGYGGVAVHADLAGRDRVLVARRPVGGGA